MPLTEKGNKIKNAMIHEYGSKEGEKVFYASKNKGTITGVDAQATEVPPAPAPVTADAASAPCHPAMMGDRSLYAGQGRGIDAVPEYKRR